jgi:ABC-2 type transport system permease protein
VIGFLLGTGLLIARTRPQDADQWTSGSLLPLVDYLLRQTQVFHSAWLPSTWASRAVLGMAEGLSSKTLFYGGLLVVYWLALSNLMWWGATAWFQRIWLDVQGRRVAARGKRGRVSFFSLGRWTGAVLTLLPVRRGIRALLWKDVVTFWRDPSQWTQASLFFGMLGFYIFNLRHIRTQLDQLFWACLVGYLNLVSVGMILAAIQTRFVFPQFTLEGRRIWILGLAPVPLERLIWGKFWLSGTAGGLMAFFLMLTSSRFLGAGTWLVVSTTLTGVVMSYSLTGLAIGLGVLHPTIGRTSHFRGEEENPARLVSGFGGTFCLVASMFYVFAVGAVEGFGMFRVMRKGGIAEDPLMFAFMVLWVVASSYWIGWFPMHMARKKLARFES